ncbi:MAG TPA: hypothetical protein VLH85_06375 [Levilinea sp.]|nr:hypothetical protein [Levilinea sp.]
MGGSGRPAPGVRIIIRWASGERSSPPVYIQSSALAVPRLFMPPGEAYSIQVGAGEIVSDLSTVHYA